MSRARTKTAAVVAQVATLLTAVVVVGAAVRLPQRQLQLRALPKAMLAYGELIRLQ